MVYFRKHYKGDAILIKSKADYKLYIAADLKSSTANISKWKWHYNITKPILRCQRLLRKVEYYGNCRKDLFGRIIYYWLTYRFKTQSIKLGITITPNVFDKGLRIAHYGSVIVNKSARIGKNFVVHSGVNIGVSKGGAPHIGDNVYVGPGAILYGGIKIGNNVKIGANSVVNKDVPANVTVAGVPAKIISRND